MSRIRIDASSRMPIGPDSELGAELSDALAQLGASIAAKPVRYVELCARTHFSFLRGGSSPQRMMQTARQLGHNTLAITDCDGLYGVVRAWEEAKRLSMKLIVGAEITVEDASTVTLLVQNHAGYSNLCRILTCSHGRHRKGEAGLPVAELCNYAEGLQALLHAPYVGARQLHAAFGARLSLAIYVHRDGSDRERMQQALEVSRTYAVPICATGNVRYAVKEDKQLYDVLTCIRNRTTLEAAGRLLAPNAEARLRSAEEIEKVFAGHPQWLTRSVHIAYTCTFELSQLRYQFPSGGDAQESSDAKLRRLTLQGADQRYPDGVPTAVSLQIEKEFAVIAQLNVAPYFLSVREIVDMARARDILCQGRGSAANSAVCFCLGITAVDPARSNLLFERFLSIERHEPPDIDIDFEHERREEVIQDIYLRYGRERAAMVSEVVSYRGKSALREVGKVLGFGLEEIGRLVSLCSYWDSTKVLTDVRLRELGFNPQDTRLRLALELAERLQGCPRHLSVHVGGFVLSDAPLVHIAPIEPAAMAGRTVIPWDKDDLDTLGFFKVDILGLGMLTALRKALDFIGDPRGETPGLTAIDRMARIPHEDPSVYAAFGRADTVGIFQIESRAQMAMLPRLRPRKFYDLVIEVAIVRPGPIQGGMVHPYLRRRNGEEAVEAPHPLLAPILDRTLGVPLFQEQVMQIAIAGAGYTGGDADRLRRDMAAWRKTGKLEAHREKLQLGFAANGILPEFAERLYKQIQGFGEYGFPESHAASFALLVYVSGWLKVHHPAAFAAALLNSQPMGFYSPATICEDAKRHGVCILPICIERSDWECTLEELPLAGSGERPARALRLGLLQVKGLGRDAGQAIVAARTSMAFVSLADLRERTRLDARQLHALAEANALSRLVADPEPAAGAPAKHRARSSQADARRRAIWQVHAPKAEGLFAGCQVDGATPRFAPLTRRAQLQLDYERTGVSLGAHPLALLRAQLPSHVKTAAALGSCQRGERVQVAGMVICRQRPATASGVVFLTLEDETGFLNLVLWSRVFEAQRIVANNAALLLCEGVLDRADLPAEVESHSTLHVIVQKLSELSMDLPSMSRDFH